MSENIPKNTPLTELHLRLGAKMGEFSGFSLPLFFKLGLMKEHQHTRENAGLFDICHMAQLAITGPDSGKFIEKICPLSSDALSIGECKYSLLLNQDAGILDDLIVSRQSDERLIVVANAGCADKDINHIKTQLEDFDAELEILDRAFVALQGPASESVLGSEGYDLSHLTFMTAEDLPNGWRISRTGYTGEDGFEISLPSEDVVPLAEKLLLNDAVEMIGLGARDSLRLEAGLSLYGQDLDETIDPLEAGLLWAIPKELRTGGEFVGAESLAHKIEQGRSRQRVGLKPLDKVPVRGGTELFTADDKPAGFITSGGFGPTANHPVALGMIPVEQRGQNLFADVRGRKIEMEQVKTPFVPHQYKR